MIDAVEIRPGEYHDSVTLMAVSRAVAERPGVAAALVAMATDLNLALLVDLGFDEGQLAGVRPADLLIAIRAVDPVSLEDGRLAADASLAYVAQERVTRFGDEVAPRTIGAAARFGDAHLAVISVPGPHVFTDALEALAAGLNVMIFSDNVPIEQEVALKREAARRGLLVMGPDCGTTILGGIGVGFANVVVPGPVGVIGASGTGIQQICCLLAEAGTGVQHAIGVGGRDLAGAVGGASTLCALNLLDGEPSVEVIVIVSKAPDPRVASLVEDAASRCRAPVVTVFTDREGDDLTAATRRALGALGRSLPELPVWPSARRRRPTGRALRGLFSGGTLCQEATMIAASRLGPVASDVALRPTVGGHVMTDFGDDALTRGRAHPMIDQTRRLERLAREGRDPSVGVVLLDVVLGHAAHPDPASVLAPAIQSAIDGAAEDGRGLSVVVSLCGTKHDPQDRDGQAETLQAAGADVFVSNADAAGHAVALVEQAAP